jgi:hypothetical protein
VTFAAKIGDKIVEISAPQVENGAGEV